VYFVKVELLKVFSKQKET